jgi:hypothetical protein
MGMAPQLWRVEVGGMTPLTFPQHAQAFSAIQLPKNNSMVWQYCHILIAGIAVAYGHHAEISTLIRYYLYVLLDVMLLMSTDQNPNARTEWTTMARKKVDLN